MIGEWRPLGRWALRIFGCKSQPSRLSISMTVAAYQLHGDSQDYMIAHARETKEIKDRPAALVIYEPK